MVSEKVLCLLGMNHTEIKEVIKSHNEKHLMK